MCDCIGKDTYPLWKNTSELFTSLADLIDPTCKMTNANLNRGYDIWGCICSACGAHIEYERARSLDYCPHCGARVVHEYDK